MRKGLTRGAVTPSHLVFEMMAAMVVDLKEESEADAYVGNDAININQNLPAAT